MDILKIYRCGWCGMPTDKDGEPLTYDDMKKEFLQIEDECDVELIQGICCENEQCEDESQSIIQVTHDMAIDAGMPELEGQWIQWS